MQSLATVLLLLLTATLDPVNASPITPAGHRETEVEASAWAREIIDSRADGQGTLASIFPQGHEFAGRPAALMEYFAPGPANGSLYMLLMPISHTIHNVFQDPDKAATFTIKDEQGERESDHGAGGTNRTRLEMWGNFYTLPDASDEAKIAKAQYIKYHPDTQIYLPPNDPHRSVWARFDPEKVFYFGGFGDTHWIGMMNMDLYRSGGKSSATDADARLYEETEDFVQQHLMKNRLFGDW